MKTHHLILSPLYLAVFSGANHVPVCSSTSSLPCACPNGTTYRDSVTFSVIGAAATDVADVISSFFSVPWLGVTPYATTGVDDTVGATRSAELATLVGVYGITEDLTAFKLDSDTGSFIQSFEQLPSTVPVEYHTHNGSFSGYWITLASQSIFKFETAITWSVYACETGYPRNFAHFHESALQNATSILTKAGKVKGTNITPYSIQAF